MFESQSLPSPRDHQAGNGESCTVDPISSCPPPSTGDGETCTVPPVGDACTVPRDNTCPEGSLGKVVSDLL